MSARPISILISTAGEYADAASDLLNEAWDPPALHYSREYLEWQCTFPCPWPLPAALAFDGPTLVGLAATTARRVRHGQKVFWVAVVSFVAVKSDRRNLGIAAGVYDRLLAAIRELSVPVITFAVSGSAGQRALERAYASAQFVIRPFGDYPSHMTVGAGTPEWPDWEASVCAEYDALPRIIDNCALDERLVWEAPDAAGIAHYSRDPRQRRLILLRRRGEEWSQAAFVLFAELRTHQGVQLVPTIEPVLLRRGEMSALAAVIQGAGIYLALKPGAVISIPNLINFDTAGLRGARVRKVSQGFQGYVCGVDPPFAGAVGTTLEIV